MFVCWMLQQQLTKERVRQVEVNIFSPLFYKWRNWVSKRLTGTCEGQSTSGCFNTRLSDPQMCTPCLHRAAFGAMWLKAFHRQGSKTPETQSRAQLTKSRSNITSRTWHHCVESHGHHHPQKNQTSQNDEPPCRAPPSICCLWSLQVSSGKEEIPKGLREIETHL